MNACLEEKAPSPELVVHATPASATTTTTTGTTTTEIEKETGVEVKSPELVIRATPAAAAITGTVAAEVENATEVEKVEENAVEKVVDMSRIILFPLADNKTITEDDDAPVSFRCPSVSLKDVKKGIKYPYVALRKLLRKKKALNLIE
jgi:hypothetical protein